jgi:hypothetical protein
MSSRTNGASVGALVCRRHTAAKRTPAVSTVAARSRDEEIGEGMLSGRVIGVGSFFSLDNRGI